MSKQVELTHEQKQELANILFPKEEQEKLFKNVKNKIKEIETEEFKKMLGSSPSQVSSTPVKGRLSKWIESEIEKNTRCYLI